MEKVLAWLWRGVGILSVIVIAIFVWLFFFVPNPQTVATTFINTLSALDKENTGLEDATIVLDIQMLKNKDNSGQELFEMAFTTYQGTNTSEKFTKGVQVVGNFEVDAYKAYHVHRNITKHWYGNTFDGYDLYDLSIKDLYSYDVSYDRNEGVAIASPTALNNSSVFVVSIGSGENMKLAQLRLRNEVIDKYHCFDNYYSFKFSCDASWSGHMGTIECYNLVSLNYMVNAVHNSVKSLDAGTYYLTFDLSEFFNIYIQDENGQFNILTQDTQFTYVTARVNVEDNGISTRNQSLFGMVAENNGSVSFEIDGSEKTFWKAQENVTISNESLKPRYSTYYDGNFLSIDNATITRLKKYENLRIHLVIDLTKLQNVVGISAYGLDGLDYYDITIIGNNQTFYFMPNSLSNVKVKAINYSSGINLVVYDDVNIDLKVVA